MLRPQRPLIVGAARARRRQRDAVGARAEDARARHRPDLRRRRSASQLPAGHDQGRRSVAGLRARGHDHAGRHARCDGRRARVRASTSTAVGRVLLLVLAVYVVASVFGLFQGRLTDAGRAAGGLPAARAGRGEAVPAAAALLRPAAARRGPQPGHQRHRQHRADAAADAEPDRHVAADHRRRAGDDVLDLAAAGADRAGHGAGVDLWSRRRSASGRSRSSSSSGRPPGELNGAHRGDVHRALAGEGVRPAAGESAATFAEHNEQAVRVELPGAVHLRASSSRR